MVALEIDIFGEHIVSRELIRPIGEAADMREVGQDIYAKFLRAEKAQFYQQGIGPSGKWAPLSPSTLRYKKGPGILRETGALFRSLTVAGDPGAIYRADKDSVEFGSRVLYGKYHQHGTKHANGSVRMPQRKPVDPSETMKREWLKMLQSHIFGGRRSSTTLGG